MYNKVVSLQKYREENTPHAVAEVICLHCKERWISVHPADDWLANWDCPKCGKHGGIIFTGQELLGDEYEEE